uniref:Uncharacterized protein n=1 Tax=Anguilla anguilla TaxID=7936 RepID=A0A0E9VY64_ANGAN
MLKSAWCSFKEDHLRTKMIGNRRYPLSFANVSYLAQP